MSYTDVTDEMRDDAYRAAHPTCVVCERECCESQSFCPSCPIDAPKPIRLSPPQFTCPDWACSEACRVVWEQGQALAAELLDGAVAAAGERS